MKVLVAWSGPALQKEVQSSIKKYTIPACRLMEMMVEQWVHTDLLDMVLDEVDGSYRLVERVLEENVMSKVMNTIGLLEMAKDVCSDGRVLAELDNPWSELKDVHEPAKESLSKTGYHRISQKIGK